MAAHRYWRLFVVDTQATSGFVQVAELQFREVAGVNQVPSGGVAIRSSVLTSSATYQASNAFDGNNATYWTSNSRANEWIGYDFGAGNEIEPVELLIGVSSSNLNYSPRHTAVEYSDDGVDWEVFCWVPAQTGWTANENRVIAISNNTGEIRYTQASGYVVDLSHSEVRYTQVGGYVVDLSHPEVRYTQAGVYIVTLPAQPVRFTQAQILTAFTPRPVPFPLPLVPEIPVVETWSWLTSVNIKDNGKEQRSLLREIPRKRLKFDFVILGDLSRREVFDILWKYQGREFLYPHYHLSTYVEPAAQGSTSLVFNPAYTDVRDGETLAIYDAHTETTRYVSVDVVTPTGADLAEPLEFDIGPASLVCSASMFHLPSSYSLAMDMVSGSSQITLESTEPRPLQRVDGSGLLTYYDGYMVLDKRPMSGVEEGYDKNVNWVDNETSKPSPVTRWRAAFSSGKRSYRFNRRQDMDYWRAFADQAKGRQKSFIMATFFDDLPLAEVPALGATELVTTNIQADEYLHTKVYRYIRIERTDGSVIFRRILDKKLVYDTNGDPVKLRLILNNSIGSAVGNNQIKTVSFAPLTRLDSDDVTLSHGDIDTIISFSTRTINE